MSTTLGCPECGPSCPNWGDGLCPGLHATPDRVQAQDSLKDQMLRVINLALERGEYDAADFITRAFFGEGTTYAEATRQ